MTKKLNEIQDWALMWELGINPNEISWKTDVEKTEILEWIKSSYNSVLMNLLEIDVEIDALSEERKKELWLTWSGKDIFVTVDENDIPVWFEFRALCHNWLNTSNKIHRAADWVVTNEKWEIFLAKRSMSKDSYPWYWEIWGGHVDWFDNYEVTLKRELEEELNIWENDIKKITPIIKFLHQDELQKQFIKVFSVVVNSWANIQNNDWEIDDKKFFWVDELLANIKQILEWKETKIKMIPHQIYCILVYMKKSWYLVDDIITQYNTWVNNNPSLKNFKILKEIWV